jgi:hypothetical protein
MKKNRLKEVKELTNAELLDILKNYVQYGYSEKIQKIAAEVLKKRGVIEEEGDFAPGEFTEKEKETQQQILLKHLYLEYRKFGFIALILHLCIIIVTPILFFYLNKTFFQIAGAFLLLFLIVLFYQYYMKFYLRFHRFKEVYPDKTKKFPFLLFLLLGLPGPGFFFLIIWIPYHSKKMKQLFFSEYGKDILVKKGNPVETKRTIL